MLALYYFGWGVTRLLSKTLTRIKVTGQENVPAEGGFILATNHISYFDPPIIGSWSPRVMYFLAKQELFRPGMRAFFRSLNSIPVRRGSVDRQAIKSCLEVLEQGQGLIIFPEGTHSPSGKMLPPKPGLGLIARQARCPVVPGCIHGANHLLACVLGRDRLSLRFGPLIPADQIAGFPDDREGYQALAEAICQRIAALQTDTVK